MDPERLQDEEALALLEYEQWSDFCVKSEERSSMDCRFNMYKISLVKVLDSVFFHC